MAAADTAPALILSFRGGLPDLFGWARARRARRPAPAPPVTREAVAFQTDLEELLNEPPPPFLGGAHHLVALLFVGLLAFAAVTHVDMVVTASGRLAADAPPIVLQPLERASLRELRVRPGDTVTAGQTLAVLDSTFTEADSASQTAQLRALTAQLRRLEGEMANQPPSTNPAADPDVLLQAVLQAQRHALYTARLRGFDEELRSLAAGIRTLEDSATLLGEQAGIARDVETLRQRLVEGQIGSRLNLLGARTQRLQTEQELRQTRNRIEELRHALQSKQAERQGFVDDWRRQLLEETVRVRGEVIRVEEQLAKATRLNELTIVMAPMDGIVLDVARRSVGSVLREAEPLVTLLPANVPLIAEVALRSADIGYTRPGDPVVLKVDAFPFQRHGTLHGTLRAIGQESFGRQEATGPDGRAAPPSGGAVHGGQVALAGPGLADLPPGARVIPGMTVTAEIKVGTRRLLSYFLNPLVRGLQESLREP